MNSQVTVSQFKQSVADSNRKLESLAVEEGTAFLEGFSLEPDKRNLALQALKAYWAALQRGAHGKASNSKSKFTRITGKPPIPPSEKFVRGIRDLIDLAKSDQVSSEELDEFAAWRLTGPILELDDELLTVATTTAKGELVSKLTRDQQSRSREQKIQDKVKDLFLAVGDISGFTPLEKREVFNRLGHAFGVQTNPPLVLPKPTEQPTAASQPPTEKKKKKPKMAFEDLSVNGKLESLKGRMVAEAKTLRVAKLADDHPLVKQFNSFRAQRATKKQTVDPSTQTTATEQA